MYAYLHAYAPSHTHTPKHPHTHTEIFTQLQSTLEQLRVEEFTWDQDINFLQATFRDPNFVALCQVNDSVARSQSFEQPEGSAEQPVSNVRERWRLTVVCVNWNLILCYCNAKDIDGKPGYPSVLCNLDAIFDKFCDLSPSFSNLKGYTNSNCQE